METRFRSQRRRTGLSTKFSSSSKGTFRAKNENKEKVHIKKLDPNLFKILKPPEPLAKPLTSVESTSKQTENDTNKTGGPGCSSEGTSTPKRNVHFNSHQQSTPENRPILLEEDEFSPIELYPSTQDEPIIQWNWQPENLTPPSRKSLSCSSDQLPASSGEVKTAKRSLSPTPDAEPPPKKQAKNLSALAALEVQLRAVTAMVSTLKPSEFKKDKTSVSDDSDEEMYLMGERSKKSSRKTRSKSKKIKDKSKKCTKNSKKDKKSNTKDTSEMSPMTMSTRPLEEAGSCSSTKVDLAAQETTTSVPPSQPAHTSSSTETAPSLKEAEVATSTSLLKTSNVTLTSTPTRMKVVDTTLMSPDTAAFFEDDSLTECLIACSIQVEEECRRSQEMAKLSQTDVSSKTSDNAATSHISRTAVDNKLSLNDTKATSSSTTRFRSTISPTVSAGDSKVLPTVATAPSSSGSKFIVPAVPSLKTVTATSNLFPRRSPRTLSLSKNMISAKNNATSPSKLAIVSSKSNMVGSDFNPSWMESIKLATSPLNCSLSNMNSSQTKVQTVPKSVPVQVNKNISRTLFKTPPTSSNVNKVSTPTDNSKNTTSKLLTPSPDCNIVSNSTSNKSSTPLNKSFDPFEDSFDTDLDEIEKMEAQILSQMGQQTSQTSLPTSSSSKSKTESKCLKTSAMFSNSFTSSDKSPLVVTSSSTGKPGNQNQATVSNLTQRSNTSQQRTRVTSSTSSFQNAVSKTQGRSSNMPVTKNFGVNTRSSSLPINIPPSSTGFKPNMPSLVHSNSTSTQNKVTTKQLSSTQQNHLNVSQKCDSIEPRNLRSATSCQQQRTPTVTVNASATAATQKVTSAVNSFQNKPIWQSSNANSTNKLTVVHHVNNSCVAKGAPVPQQNAMNVKQVSKPTWLSSNINHQQNSKLTPVQRSQNSATARINTISEQQDTAVGKPTPKQPTIQSQTLSSSTAPSVATLKTNLQQPNGLLLQQQQVNAISMTKPSLVQNNINDKLESNKVQQKQVDLTGKTTPSWQTTQNLAKNILPAKNSSPQLIITSSAISSMQQKPAVAALNINAQSSNEGRNPKPASCISSMQLKNQAASASNSPATENFPFTKTANVNSTIAQHKNTPPPSSVLVQHNSPVTPVNITNGKTLWPSSSVPKAPLATAQRVPGGSPLARHKSADFAPKSFATAASAARNGPSVPPTINQLCKTQTLIRHKSAGDFGSMKTNSQQQRYSAEEIERKRQEAMLRLMQRRQQQVAPR